MVVLDNSTYWSERAGFKRSLICSKDTCKEKVSFYTLLHLDMIYCHPRHNLCSQNQIFAKSRLGNSNSWILKCSCSYKDEAMLNNLKHKQKRQNDSMKRSFHTCHFLAVCTENMRPGLPRAHWIRKSYKCENYGTNVRNQGKAIKV